MKRLLMGVFVFALIFSSCNKYADDFQALKDQISALAAQVKGVSDLQTTIASQTATIAALQTSINTLSTTVGGLGTKMTALSDSLTAVGKRVTYISNSVASIVATGNATKAMVTDVQTNLNNFIAAQNIVNADFKAKLIALQNKLDLAATSAEVQAAQSAIVSLINSQVIALTTAQKASADSIVNVLTTRIQLGDGATQQAITEFKNWVDGINTINLGKLNQILTDLATANSTADETKLVVDGLAAEMALAQGKLDILLKSNAMINEDVTIRNHADLIYWANKITQTGVIVNGNVSVNTQDLTTVADLALLKLTLNNIIAVIGVNPASVAIIDGWWTLFGVYGTLTPIAGAPHWVYIQSAKAADVEINNLVFVIGDYTVLLNDVKDEAITTVGGTFKYDYPGNYMSNVTTVGNNLILVDQSVHAVANGTGTINLPNVNVGAFVGDGTPAVPVNGTVTWNSTATTSIILGLGTDADATEAGDGQIHWLTANSATSVKLGTVAYTAAGIDIDALVLLTADLSAATSSAGVVNIHSGVDATHGTATLVNLSGLLTSGSIQAWVAATCDVQLPVWNSAVAVDIRGDQVLTIPMWKGLSGSTLNAPETQTLTLDSYEWLSASAASTIPSAANLLVIKNLKLGGAVETVNIAPYTTLITVDITGITLGDNTHWADINGGSTGLAIATDAKPGVRSTGNALLTTVKLGGLMNTVNLSTMPLLVNVTTWGIINSTTLNAIGTTAPGLTALTLAHANFQGITGFGGPGSDLVVTNNTKLASLTTTGLNKMQSFIVHDNALLSTLTLSSYQDVINSIALLVDLQVYNNNLSGTFTPALAPFGTTPYQEATITCATLSVLKDYVHKLKVAYGDVPATFASFRVDVDDVDAATAGKQTLGTAMDANKLVSTIIGAYPAVRTAATAIANDAQMQLIQ